MLNLLESFETKAQMNKKIKEVRKLLGKGNFNKDLHYETKEEDGMFNLFVYPSVEEEIRNSQTVVTTDGDASYSSPDNEPVKNEQEKQNQSNPELKKIDWDSVNWEDDKEYRFELVKMFRTLEELEKSLLYFSSKVSLKVHYTFSKFEKKVASGITYSHYELYLPAGFAALYRQQ